MPCLCIKTITFDNGTEAKIFLLLFDKKNVILLSCARDGLAIDGTHVGQYVPGKQGFGPKKANLVEQERTWQVVQ